MAIWFLVRSRVLVHPKEIPNLLRVALMLATGSIRRTIVSASTARRQPLRQLAVASCTCALSPEKHTPGHEVGVLSITSAPLVFALETGNGVNLPPGGKAPPVVRPAVQTRGAGSHRSSTVNRSLRKIKGLSSSYLKCSWFLLFLHRVSARGAWSQRERSAATQLLTCGHFVLARIRAGTRGAA